MRLVCDCARFQVGFQLDLLLLLKLAVVVFVFNQDGSKNRLVVLLLLAAIAYMQVSPDNHSLKK